MPTIYYTPDDRPIQAERGQTILNTSLENGIPHIHVCGGNARCSTCRVMVLEGLEYLPPRNEKEQRMADLLMLPPEIRLSCQTTILGDLKVRRLVLDDEDIAVTDQSIKKETRPEPVGSEKRLAIMFADIRNFTQFSETHVPYDVIHLLNRYYYRIGKIIRAYGGHIDNYIGDGIMAIFGADDPNDAAYCAVKAGLEMLETVTQMRPYVQAIHNWELRIGIGIHYGMVVVGNVGSRERQHETAIGDAVNFAARIEQQNKSIGSELLISQETLNAIGNHIVKIGQTCAVSIKGKSGEYLVYEVLALD